MAIVQIHGRVGEKHLMDIVKALGSVREKFHIKYQQLEMYVGGQSSMNHSTNIHRAKTEFNEKKTLNFDQERKTQSTCS